MDPIVHANNSMKRNGGNTDSDFSKFLAIHRKMDCSKNYLSDSRHRALTHTFFWIAEVMVPLFGDYITLDSGKKVSVKKECESHILEDYMMKFIPTVQDWIAEIEIKDWMQNGTKGLPSSAKKLYPELDPSNNKIPDFKFIPCTPLPPPYIERDNDYLIKIVD